MHIVIGTAGHVDHGKTTLVAALTGVDCDRLAEEKARGITIELGFARWEISDKLSASIIDVPGHEKLVSTMVAGASGIDCVLLVVAADDGVMEQTREHLAICNLLGVERGIVALTKCDLADDDLLALVEEDIRAATRGTFLEKADIVHCSAKTRVNLDALGNAIIRSVREITTRREGPAFVAIDRSFSRAGVGTIVTGTLIRGTLAVDDEVESLPTKKGEDSITLRIRSMEAHGTPVKKANATTRIALSLRGDDDAIARGTAVVARGSASQTNAVHADVSLLGAAKLLHGRTDVKLHIGTTSLAASLLLLDRDRLEWGENAIALLRTESPFPTFAGQRFVLRRSGKRGNVTIGGGVIKDPHPRIGRKKRDPFFFVHDTAKERVHALIKETRHTGITAAEIQRRSGDSAVDGNEIVECDGRFFDAAIFQSVTTTILDLVRDIEKERPLASGVTSGEIATRAPPHIRPLVIAVLTSLVTAKKLTITDGLYRIAGERNDAAVLDRIVMCFRVAGFSPPADEIAAAHVALPLQAFKDATAELRRRGTLRMIGGFHYEMSVLKSLRDIIARWFESGHTTLAPTDFKDLCGGITRRHAIPLLEWLDQERITLRRGDARVRGSS